MVQVKRSRQARDALKRRAAGSAAEVKELNMKCTAQAMQLSSAQAAVLELRGRLQRERAVPGSGGSRSVSAGRPSLRRGRGSGGDVTREALAQMSAIVESMDSGPVSGKQMRPSTDGSISARRREAPPPPRSREAELGVWSVQDEKSVAAAREVGRRGRLSGPIGPRGLSEAACRAAAMGSYSAFPDGMSSRGTSETPPPRSAVSAPERQRRQTWCS